MQKLPLPFWEKQQAKFPVRTALSRQFKVDISIDIWIDISARYFARYFDRYFRPVIRLRNDAHERVRPAARRLRALRLLLCAPPARAGLDGPVGADLQTDICRCLWMLTDIYLNIWIFTDIYRCL